MDKWAEDESTELDQLFWSLYGPLLRISCIFPSWTRANRLISIIIFTWITVSIGFHLPLLLWSVWLERDDFSLSSMSLHYLVLLLFGTFSVTIFQFNRKNVVKVHKVFLGDMWSYCSGRVYDDEAVKNIQTQIDNETIKLLIFPTGLVGIIAFAILIGPYVRNFGEEEVYKPSGVSTTLPVPGWYPFDTHSGLAHAATVLAQLAVAATIGAVVVTDFLIFYRVSQKMRFEYKVLSYSVSSILDRAFQMYTEEHKDRKKAQEMKKIDPYDPAYQHYIGLCLRDCVLHHYQIADMQREFEEMISWQVGLAYLAGMAAIGLSVINIMMLWSQREFENVIVFGFLMLSETINMLIISAIGEAVTSESETLRNQLYFMEWYKLNLSNRKTFLNFQVGVTEPVVIRTGILMDVCLDTFTTIINSAYSFFNLLMGT